MSATQEQIEAMLDIVSTDLQVRAHKLGLGEGSDQLEFFDWEMLRDKFSALIAQPIGSVKADPSHESVLNHMARGPKLAHALNSEHEVANG
jgi:hypothetical protein